MKVETGPIHFTPEKYYRIIVLNYLTKRIWVYLVMMAVTIYSIYYNPDGAVGYAMLVVFIGFFIFELLSFRKEVYKPENDLLYKETQFVINDNHIRELRSDEKFKWGEYIKYRKVLGAVLLYTSDGLFHYFPKGSFQGANDYQGFIAMVQSKL